ncbi:MAG: tryptophan synthase subunit alpha [Anaerolineae bacterium]
MSTETRGPAAIERAFRTAASEGRAALITYLTLGYPSPQASLPLVQALADGGADIIELGVPFSDPVADGPVIQRASHAALEAGITPEGCLDLAAQIRASGVGQPLVLMGYYNPIYTIGQEAYVRRCAESGVDGLIVPDLPPEEADALDAACRQHNVALIYLVAPTSSPERRAVIAARTEGFMYLVSRLGTTGRGELPVEALRAQVSALRPLAHTPIAVGFGVSTPEQVRAVAATGADGVIVGSAIVERAVAGPEALRGYVAELRAALETGDPAL